jgi:hypothetical protein
LEQINQLKLKEIAVIARPAGPWQSSGPHGLPRRAARAMTAVLFGFIQLICHKEG